jgi:hypothetical protein
MIRYNTIRYDTIRYDRVECREVEKDSRDEKGMEGAMW